MYTRHALVLLNLCSVSWRDKVVLNGETNLKNLTPQQVVSMPQALNPRRKREDFVYP